MKKTTHIESYRGRQYVFELCVSDNVNIRQSKHKHINIHAGERARSRLLETV